MSARYLPPPQLWLLCLACVLALVLLWWSTFGTRRFRRWRGLRKRIASDAARGVDADVLALRDTARTAMRQAIARACASILESPARSCRLGGAKERADGLYLAPWFLFLGEHSAQVDALIAAARTCAVPSTSIDAAEDEVHSGTLPSPQAQPPPFWRWHRFDDMVAIAVSSELLDPRSSEAGSVLWFEALLELADRRPRLPLNGLVLCASIANLARGPSAIEAAASSIRTRLVEAADLLRLHLPVYVVVTGLDDLPGFDRFRAALPEATRAQALGHRFMVARPGEASQAMRGHQAIQTLAARLHALRLGLLCDAQCPVDKAAIQGFFEPLLATLPRLESMIDLLFQAPGPPRRIQWRGLYLAASGSPETDVFVHDLFARFLPADQPLAHN